MKTITRDDVDNLWGLLADFREAQIKMSGALLECGSDSLAERVSEDFEDIRQAIIVDIDYIEAECMVEDKP